MHKARKIVSGAIGIVMLCVFVYGMVRFPDAPIHPCGHESYCGKQSQTHSHEEYVAFTEWNTTLFCVWPFGLLSLFLLNRRKSA
jgi:hypothetical protein